MGENAEKGTLFNSTPHTAQRSKDLIIKLAICTNICLLYALGVSWGAEGKAERIKDALASYCGIRSSELLEELGTRDE